MKFQRRAIYIGGASWLILCATGNGALAQDAATSTQLPDITVTAPSPIQRHRAVVPARAPVRAARTVPGRNRERTAQAQPAPAPKSRSFVPQPTSAQPKAAAKKASLESKRISSSRATPAT